MAFDPFHTQLPVTEIIPEVKEKLAHKTTLIITAPPGAGKSTLLPLALLDEPWLQGKKILMLEPRRLAASSIADRMASLLGEPLGKTVGYRIRFDNRVSAQTKIEVVTEGILTRMIHNDNSLENIGLVIFDEFHERNIHADVAMAFCRETQMILRPDLRIIVMSATMDMPQLSRLLDAPVVESKGKQYPVEIKYGSDIDERLLAEMTSQTIRQAAEENEGDILAFLPGQGEIRQCEELLKKILPGFSVHPLYGQLSPTKQYAAIMPHPKGKRKIVLATSIAETSLTIEGIAVVVDSGFGRTSKFDPRSGLSRLVTVRISEDMADQRAGRAGRLAPGICYRLWSQATQTRIVPFRTPEILEADLASLVLDMAQWGIRDIQQLTWLTPPPSGALAQANDTLHQLDALENNKITTHGKHIHNIPCHPRIAHMLLMAGKNQRLPLATDLAAILEERDPMDKEAGIDINLRIEALRKHRTGNGKGRKFDKIEKIAASYRKLLDVGVQNGPIDPYETGILLAYAYPERIAYARPGANAQFQLANGKFAMAAHRDGLANKPWLAIAHIDAREGTGKIFMAAPLNPKDLAPLIKEKEVITWDTRKGGLIAQRELRLGSIIIQSKPLPSPDIPQRVEAISKAIKNEGLHLLDFNENVCQWQNRIMSLRRWRPEDNWLDVSTSTLLLTNSDWLGPYLQDVAKPDDLKKLNLLKILQHSLDYEKQRRLASLAPEKIEVPSGSLVKIEYQPNGEVPVLAVRLQELFGLTDSPKVNENRTSLLLHLLSPGYKPVQITSDLKSFWDNAYFEVRKELKRRYPKHSWPEDPWNAEAVRGVKHKR